VATRSGWASANGQVVPNDLSALHDQRNPQHFSDVSQGIAGDGDQISDLALFDRAETILLVDDGGIDRGSHLQGERRGGAPLDENREHFGLHAVRALAGLVENAPLAVRDRRRPAAVAEPNPGGQHLLLLPGHLLESPPAVGPESLEVTRFIL